MAVSVLRVLINDKWLLEYGIRHNLRPDMTGMTPDMCDEAGSIISAATLDIMAKGRIYFSSTLRTVLSYDKKPLCCLVLVTNDPLDNLPLPPPEKWARLKEILETEEEPHWYLALT